MNSLAETYGALGRHEESLVLKEQAVELLRRWLPENHPTLGRRGHIHSIGRGLVI